MKRQAIVSTVTLLALCGLLAAGAVVGWNTMTADVPSVAPAPKPSPACAPEEVQAGQRIRSRQVTVSVYNGGTREGLADQTLDALTRRGFIAGEVGNAPSDIKVRRVQVWSTVEDDIRARLVARQFGKRTKIRYADEELGPGVDVIVGNGFRKGLVKAKRSLRVKSEQRVCLPVESPRADASTDAAAGALSATRR